MKSKLVVIGAAGRMGQRILSLAVESNKFDIIAAIERKDHPCIGKDAGLLAGTKPINVKLDSIYTADADVAIDFSLPEAADKTTDYCDTQREKIKTASQEIPIVYATNMSVGMNVLFSLVGKVASLLGQDYDIEIIEQHHRFKKDAPSGSAITLAENICKATGRDFPGSLTHGRFGKDTLRQKNNIGIHAVRAGDIVGKHDCIFSTLGETITFGHTAHSRDTFARGALRAAEWLVNKKPALYSMADVLGIH
jgi:4-hydroxy-tetrahydrodipicolinate reductase